MFTVVTYSVFITAAVHAHEGRDMAKFDLTGAYFYKETDKGVIILLEGELSDLMVKVSSRYIKSMPSLPESLNLFYIYKHKKCSMA